MRCATPRTPLMPATSGAAAAEAALEPLAVFCGLWGVLIVPVARSCSSTVGLAMVLDRLDAPPRTEPTPPAINPAALIAMVRPTPERPNGGVAVLAVFTPSCSGVGAAAAACVAAA